MNLVRWGIIIYTTVGLIHYVFGYLRFTKEFEFISKATGPYWIFYWLMLFSSTILPYSLLFRKLKDRPWYLLFIAFSMKLGVYFERFVLIVINFHRDYVPRSWSFKTFGFPTHEFLMIFLQGFLLAILLLVLYEFVDRKINMQSATSL
ncbi:hypothetical protein [Aquimarina amphilecti]|uniref:hypothetical protein n=1 Tax=Aquimarina amphilecti TaxID=1038014 RepID=UPI0011143A2C|nr:hypothetical protein [Aquimarina amphilecti]